MGYLRAEAERLYEEVIAEYGDVPHVTARDRMLEALLRQPEPRRNGRPLTDEGRRRIEAGISDRRSTLGKVAGARLDDWYNPAVVDRAVPLRAARATWPLDAAVWTFRLPAITPPLLGHRSRLTGGPVLGVH